MRIFKNQSFQLFASLLVGSILGAWQLIPSASLSSLPKQKMEKRDIERHYRNTAELEPILSLTLPDKNASVDAWYRFALSLDDLELGQRYDNSADATPLLSWYTLIAKYKPQALYKLYNQGKLNEMKFNHLLRFGYLKYWDESIVDTDEVLLSNSQAVLTMAYHKGVNKTRVHVKQAFFKLAETQLGRTKKPDLDIENLLFAIKGMSNEEKTKVPVLLKSGVFSIDPQYLYRLKLDETFNDNQLIVALIKQYSEKIRDKEKVFASYMVDGALLGSKQYIQTMIDNVEFNADQRRADYCAACGLALSTEGLIGFPLINASKVSKLSLENTDSKGAFILSRKGAAQ